MAENLIIKNNFKYTFKDKVTISDFTEALRGYEDLVSQFLPDILNKIFDTDVNNVDIYIQEISEGSYDNKFWFRMFFKDKEDFENFASQIQKIIGFDALKNEGKPMRAIITAVILGLTGFSIYTMATQSNEKAGDTVTNNINNNINLVLNQQGDIPEEKLNGEQLTAIIRDLVSNDHRQKKAIENTQKFLKPIQDHGGNIEGGDVLLLEENTIKQAPKDFEFKDTHEFEEEDYGVPIDIKAKDIESYKQGWRVSIDKYEQKRVRMQINEDLNLDELDKKRRIYGNITVIKELKTGQRSARINYIILNSYSESPIQEM